VTRLLLLFWLPLMLFADDTFRIAAYNVENLFDLERSGHEYAEYIPDTPWRWNAENYRLKLKHTARAIADIRPDVIGLVEIESAQALRDLQAELKRAGLYLPYRAIADAKDTTVRTALLSRFPIKVKREIWVNRGHESRNILEVKIETEGEPLYLFVNHWKSKSGPESERVRSAKALKKRLVELGEVNYVLLGDFNSHYDEKHLFARKRKHNDTDGITGINDILATMRGERPVTPDQLAHCPQCAYSLWYELPEPQRWSHVFHGQKEALDAIIVSPKLADGKGLEYVRGSFAVFAPRYLLTAKGVPYRWQRSRARPVHHTGKGYSDHLPIYADFALN